MAMNYTTPFLYFRAGGHFGDSNQQLDHWSIGLKFASPPVPVPYDPAELATFVDTTLVALQAFHANVGSYVGNQVFLDWASGARVGTDGKYDPLDQETYVTEISPLAGGQTQIHPWNTALVISLRTARPRGLASNGRCYYPALGLGVAASSGRAAGANVQARLDLFRTFINAANAAASDYAIGTRLCVMSGIRTGATEVVTSIRSDTRFDSIERRENDLPPDWKEASIP